MELRHRRHVIAAGIDLTKLDATLTAIADTFAARECGTFVRAAGKVAD